LAVITSRHGSLRQTEETTTPASVVGPQAPSRSAGLLRYGRMRTSPSLTVFFGLGVVTPLSWKIFENRAIDTDSRRNRADRESVKFPFEIKSANS
jgi:hypothetical protein